MIANIDPLQPTFAILTMMDENKRFRGNRQNFIDIIRTGKEMGVQIFVITVQELSVSKRFVNGYFYDFIKRKWFTQTAPLPRVIYNRIPFREDEWQPEVKRTIRACLRSPHVHLYNPFFFNKWDLFSWLRRSSKTRGFIPKTRRWSKKLKLKPILSRHGLLYLKPEKGKAGRGIMKLQYEQKKGAPYVLTIQDERNSSIHKFSNLAALRKKCKEQMDQEEYIVQQGIVLAKYKNRPFDLRVLVQKNLRGHWTLTGIGARVAGASSITTHVPRGGSIDDPEKLLSFAFGRERTPRMMSKIRRSVLSIAKQIERASRQPVGEMSMDLGLDANARLWFFEANSKPMKFDEPDIRKKSLQRLIEYGLYLHTQPKLSDTRKKGR